MLLLCEVGVQAEAVAELLELLAEVMRAMLASMKTWHPQHLGLASHGS